MTDPRTKRALEAAAWQLPVSAMGRGKNDAGTRVHYFEHSRSTYRLITAACGRWFNPGFALVAKVGEKRCAECRKALGKVKRAMK